MSTGSEKNTTTSVFPFGALDAKLGMVSSVNGCAETKGIDENDNTSNTISNFLIYIWGHIW